MNNFSFLEFSFVDVLDIVLVALLLFYLYKLVKGTVAINIFIGIVIFYVIWKLTDILNLDVLSNILGKFISVGFFALIVVFQQEIRKFLLLIGSTNFASRRNVIRYFNFLNQDQESLKIDLTALLSACNKMASEKTGAIIANLIWFPLGFFLIIVYFLLGIIMISTIIGIPIGMVYMKIGKFIIRPVGTRVIFQKKQVLASDESNVVKKKEKLNTSVEVINI